MKKDNLKLSTQAVLIGLSALGLGGKWVWDRRTKFSQKLKSIFKNTNEKLFSDKNKIDDVERKKILKYILSDKKSIINALIFGGSKINPVLEINMDLDDEILKEKSKHLFNKNNEISKIFIQKNSNFEEDIYFLAYELSFSVLENIFYKKDFISINRIHNFQKSIESELVTFLVLTELKISISKDVLDRLDDVLQKKENYWIKEQLNQNRINRSAELILSKVYMFFKEKYSIQLDKDKLENSTKPIHSTKNISEIIQSLSDLELIKLNKIVKVLKEQRYLELRSLIAEFKETSKTNKEIESLIKNFLNLSNDLYSGPSLEEININKTIKLNDLLIAIESSRESLVSEKEIKALRIFLKEPKGLKRINWNCTQIDIKEALFIDLSDKDLKAIKNEIALNWFKENQFPIIPNSEQLEFIVNTNNSIKLTARAGSGKTTTICLKILFLVHFYGLRPEEILITTFNTSASDDLRNKISKYELAAKLVERPNKYFVYNFDKISASIVGSRQNVVEDEKDGELNAIKNIVKNILENDDVESLKIKRFIIKAFQSDWTEWFNDDKSNLSSVKLNQLRDNQIIKLIDGKRVESLGEKRIGDFFIEHAIEFEYEETNNYLNYKNYKPDFYLPQYKCVIEYFGMQGDKKYDEERRKKQEDFLSQKELSLIEIYPRDFERFGDHFLDNREKDYETISNKINTALGENLNILSRRLNEEQLIELIDSSEESDSFEYFSKLYQSVIQKIQQRCSSLPEVISFVNRYDTKNSLEKEFVDLIPSLYRFYKNQLLALNKTNFSEVKWKAVDLLQEGKNRIVRDNIEIIFDKLSFIFIDEFQDFSQLYQEIILKIVRFSENISVNTVGDDMQLINRFMGSELKYFNQFSESYKNSVEMKLTENRRSAKEIIDFCNQIIQNNSKYLGKNIALSKLSEPNKNLKGRISFFDLNDLRPEDIEIENFDSDRSIISLNRSLNYAKKFLDNHFKKSDNSDEPSFFILSRFKKLRTKGLAKNISLANNRQKNTALIKTVMEKTFSEKITPENISFRTVHSSKGDESTAVIIPDFHIFPFIHPSSQFLGIFDDTPESLITDELKLLYVACTRAEQDLIFICNSNKKEHDFFGILPTKTNWENAEMNYEIFGEYYKIEIRINSSREFNKALSEIKKRGYRYDPIKTNWKKTNKDKDYCINEISQIRNTFKAIDGRILIRFLNSANEIEIEMELPLKDNWDDYLNSYKLNKELKDKKI